MNNPLHAPYFADAAEQHQVEIVENERVARDTYRLRFACPPIAKKILPGQFVMVRLSHCDDPLIGRPLALYDVNHDANHDQPASAIDVMYLVKGKFTTRLASYFPGQQLDVWGPLGNGFSRQSVDHLILVAGGIGQTPFAAVARDHLGQYQYGQEERNSSSQPTRPTRPTHPTRPTRITFCYGARSKDYFACVDDFERLGVEVHLATDDGSAGHHGLVTQSLQQVLQTNDAVGGSASHQTSRCIFCCGPEPMMAQTARIAAEAKIDCYASLETPMACGVGICFTCVAKVRTAGGQWDYKRTCVEGPIFHAEDLVW